MSSNEASMATCQHCGEPLESQWDSCPACGTRTSSRGVLTCPNCTRPIKPHWRLCPACKHPLPGTATPTSAVRSGEGVKTPAIPDQIFVSMIGDGTGSEPHAPLELPISTGDELGGRYTIRGRLGAGGFGAVYEALDSVTNEELALKVVVAAQGEGRAERAVEQILHEFRLRKQINDVTHILKSEDPRPCDFKGLSLVLLPMELADGGSLRQWLARNRDVEKRRKQGLELFRHACQGVRAIHEAGLVHMDVKPENILVVDQKAKVTDFGIGRFVGMGYANNPEQLLHQGVGTPQYMSPEQFVTARQKNIDHKSDLYSLGLILYEILDGGLPFDGSPIELRDKHLKMAPPRLEGTAQRWWPVIERCLAKKPEERYPSVAVLIKDLDRVEQGAVLSVDVSCPSCGHINANPHQKSCESCKTDLSRLFHPCPRCARDVRMDTETCPGCGEGVLAYYTLQERWQTIERLRDEDPVEAIELLEVTLRDGAGEYQERAVERIRELRAKQGKVTDLIVRAGKANVDGALEEALEAWRQVLAVIPRHRVAQEKVQATEELLATYQAQRTEAFKLMEEAGFAEAERLLAECLKMLPARRQAQDDLESCRGRARTYHQALQDARTAYENKELVRARTYVARALSEASKSREAESLRKKIFQDTDRACNLLEQVHELTLQAEFPEALKCLVEINSLQEDLTGVCQGQENLERVQKAYTTDMEAAQAAGKELDLEAAHECVRRALNSCPASMKAKQFSCEIEAGEREAHSLVTEARALIDKAEFEAARKNIEKTRTIWPGVKGLTDTSQLLNRAQDAYTRAMGTARQAQAEKNLDQGIHAVDEALKACPKAHDAAQLKKIIQGAQQAARKALDKANALARAADFDSSRKELEQADLLWPTLPGLRDATQRIGPQQDEYGRHLAQARTLFEKRDYPLAKDTCRKALHLCPDSKTAQSLTQSIEQAEDAERRATEARLRDKLARRAAAKGAALRMGKWSLVAVVAGVVLVVVVLLAFLFWGWFSGTAWPWCKSASGLKALATIEGILLLPTAFLIGKDQGMEPGEAFVGGLFMLAVLIGACVLAFLLVFHGSAKGGLAMGLLLGILMETFMVLGGLLAD